MERRRRTRKAIGLAKLTPPSLPVVLKRPRLFRLLDKARARPVTWIAAPAGSGKTTLVASYLKARRLPVLWYRLDETDADPSSFFHFLTLAAKSLAPRVRTPLPVLTPEYALGLPTFARRFFQEFCARLPRRCVLVLDNYQEVPTQSVLHDLLAHAFQELPMQVSVIVMSRHDPQPTMTALHASQTMTQIDAEALNLLKSEAMAIVRLHLRGRTDRAIKMLVDDIYTRVGGWAAGVILTLEHSKSRYPAVPDRVTQAPETIFQYLAGEVLDRLSADKQELLLRTSVLFDISVPMAEQLSNLPHAGDILMALHAGRYFTERRQGAESSYRYHPLFRDFLLDRAKKDLGPVELRALQRKAAELLVNSGCIEDGVLLLQAAEEWDGLVPVILAQASSLIEVGRIQTVEMWILSVPESVRNETPWLKFWLATTRGIFSPDEAYELFDKTLSQFLAQREQTGALLSWCGMVRAALMRWNSFGQIKKLLELFPAIHPDGTPYPSVEVKAHVADCMAGAIMETQPYRSDARNWLDRADRLSDHLPLSAQVGSRFMREIYYLWFGDIAAARASLEQFSRLSHERERNPIFAIFFHGVSATLAWFESEFDLCRIHVGKARELASRSGLHVWDGFIIPQGIAGELLAGNLAAAEALLREEDAITERIGGIQRAHFEHLFSWCKRLRGDFQKALEHLQRSNEWIAMAGGEMFAEGLNEVLMAHVFRELAQSERAAQCVERAMEIGDRMQSDLLRFGAGVLTAQLAFDRGDEPSGLAALKKAFAIGEARGLMMYPGRQPDMLGALCAKALEAGIQVPFVQRMIRKHGFPAPSEARLVGTWPWRVKIHTFGKLVVEVDGKPLEKQRKAPHRLLELLAAIVAFGGHDVPVSRLIDALWPDVDGDTGHENFKKSIARLRKLLSVDDLIRWEDGKISLNPDLCWVDTLAFDQHTKEQDARAMARYTGPFLGPEKIPAWAESRRDQERTRFIRLVNRHCDDAQTAGNVEEAIRSLERAIDADPVAEPLYQRLISLLIAQGREADAQRHYRTCVKVSQQWGTGDISLETLRLGQLFTH